MPEALTTLSIYRRQEQPREGCRRMPDGNIIAALSLLVLGKAVKLPGIINCSWTQVIYWSHLVIFHMIFGVKRLHKKGRQFMADTSSFLSSPALKGAGKGQPWRRIYLSSVYYFYVCHVGEDTATHGRGAAAPTPVRGDQTPGHAGLLGTNTRSSRGSDEP